MILFLWGLVEKGKLFHFESKGGEQGYSAVVRELASFQCGFES